MGLRAIALLIGLAVLPLGVGPFAWAETAVAEQARPLSDYAGTYKLKPDVDLTFFVRDAKLFAERKFQPATELTRVSDDSFVAESVGARFDFERNAQGKVIAVTMDQAEAVFRAEKRSP